MNISNENRPGDNDVVHMIRCDDCGHMVPAPNLTIHQATACAGRARPHSSDEEEEEKKQAATADTRVIQQLSDDDDSLQEALQQQQQQQSLRQRRRHARNGDSNQDMAIRNERRPFHPAPASLDISNAASRPPPEVITIPDSPPSAAAAAMPSSPASTNEWPCPRCTLFNPNSQNLCNACGYHRGGGSNSSPGVRAPDPSRRDTFLPPHPQSPGAAIGGGALLGSVLGAAGAYMNGRPLSSGAIEGAMSGAMGAALVSSVWNQPAPMSPSQRAFAAPPHIAMHPRASFRVVRRRNPDGSVTEHVYVHSPSAAGMPLDRSASDLMMRHAMMQAMGGGGGINPDNMSYEQMLEMFGDGSENRGATERDIRALPVSTVNDPFQLPEDKRQCSICLEDFKPGDKRKVMSCLHGFHCECLDKWLRTNGSCPVCKHRVAEG